jgi:hypothetical protein
MEQLSANELLERLAWAKQQVSQLEAECERWRNQALLAEAKVRNLQDVNLELRQKMAQSLPLYDPDEFIPDRR